VTDVVRFVGVVGAEEAQVGRMLDFARCQVKCACKAKVFTNENKTLRGVLIKSESEFGRSYLKIKKLISLL